MCHVTLTTPHFESDYSTLLAATWCPKVDQTGFSRSRDMVMVGACQSLNGSRDLTNHAHFRDGLRHIWAIALASIKLYANFEVFIRTYSEDTKGDIKCRKSISVTQCHRK